MMKNRFFSIFAIAAMVSLAACGGREEGERGEGETEIVTSDTAAVQGMDTVSVPTAVPTTDSVVTTTTVDTIHGEAAESSSVELSTRP